jgi:hypothetical protein
MYTSQNSSGQKIYKIKLRETDCDDSDMSKEWMRTEYQKHYCKRKSLKKHPEADHKHGG